MKKTTILIFTVMLLFFSTSCTQTVENSADEIRMNKWCLTTKYDNEVTLNFLDDIGIFQVKSTDKRACVKLKGLCIIDKDKISIYNEADKENYIFKYKLKSNKLMLSYMGGKITLLRDKRKNPSEQ